jgi:hypothetical protein
MEDKVLITEIFNFWVYKIKKKNIIKIAAKHAAIKAVDIIENTLKTDIYYSKILTTLKMNSPKEGLYVFGEIGSGISFLSVEERIEEKNKYLIMLEEESKFSSFTEIKYFDLTVREISNTAGITSAKTAIDIIDIIINNKTEAYKITEKATLDAIEKYINI